MFLQVFGNAYLCTLQTLARQRVLNTLTSEPENTTKGGSGPGVFVYWFFIFESPGGLLGKENAICVKKGPLSCQTMQNYDTSVKSSRKER